MALRTPFTRSEDRWLGGVAAGLAHRLGIDPALTRSLFLLLTIAGGLGLIAYGLAWVLLPDKDGEILTAELFRGRPQSGLVGGIVMFVIGLTRPLLWFWESFLGYGSAYGLFWVLNVWALMIAALVAATVLVLAWRARRRRFAMDLEMVTEPITQILDGDPTEPIPANFGGLAMADAATAVLPRKTWFAQSAAPGAGAAAPLPAPARAPRAPRQRRTKAGSRHVQLTLAATFLAIAAVALINDSVLSFRSIGQAIGAVAMIWGVSVAVAAARGRRAGGTSLIATLLALACAPALAVISLVPTETLDADLTKSCPRLLGSEPIACAVTTSWPPLTIANLPASSEPFTYSTGLGDMFVTVDSDQPVIIDVEVTLGRVNMILPGWTLVIDGTEQVMDFPEAYTDSDGTPYLNYPLASEVMTPGGEARTITLISPNATRGVSPELRINAGVSSIQFESFSATENADTAVTYSSIDTTESSNS